MSGATKKWGTRFGLILAVAGSAVGLGNFLRFPVQAIQNGGGAFLIPYLISFLLLGIPLLWVEWAMGRYAGQFDKHSPAYVFGALAPGKRRWVLAGSLGIFINLVVGAYYCYIESWTLTYAFLHLKGHFDGMSADQVMAYFSAYTSSENGIPWLAIGMFLVTLGLNCLILGQSLSKGIERISMIGMPILILFAIGLAIKAVMIKAGEDGALFDGVVGLNHLWTPRIEALANPNVWLAATGQIFFTTAVGMGIIHSYASYMNRHQDIALSAMTAGWMNEFVEVVLGSSILIPISIAYLGINQVQEVTKSGGLGLAFNTMPYLFTQWGSLVGAIAGFAFFGLLFFAGITSSIAMGTPWMSFMADEFGWSRTRGTLSFGLICLVLGLPCIMLPGWLDEFDYWAGTVSLVVFGLVEVILFAWVFGLDRGWAEINLGADLKISRIFRPVIKFVMPTLLALFLLASTISPQGGNWSAAFSQLSAGQGWPISNDAILSRIANKAAHEKLASLNDQAAINQVKDQIFHANAARATLLVVIGGLAVLVLVSFRRQNSSINANQNS